ncbi:MAG TPA: hypothetical protein VIX89_14440 [Bryobacteraceae bacterium]
MSKLLVVSVFTLAAVCMSPAEPAPFACNLKAFSPDQRVRWRQLIEHVASAVTEARELKDGYSLKVNAGQAQIVEVAEWIELERRCCPFFDFQMDVHGEDGSVWLSLKGRDGVKDFIRADFSLLRDKLRKSN